MLIQLIAHRPIFDDTLDKIDDNSNHERNSDKIKERTSDTNWLRQLQTRVHASIRFLGSLVYWRRAVLPTTARCIPSLDTVPFSSPFLPPEFVTYVGNRVCTRVFTHMLYIFVYITQLWYAKNLTRFFRSSFFQHICNGQFFRGQF